MKFHAAVCLCVGVLVPSCALQICVDSDDGVREEIKSEQTGPSDAEYNEIFRYLEQTKDSAEVQIAKICAFLDQEGADVDKIVVDARSTCNDNLNIVHAVALTIRSLDSKQNLARALAGVADDVAVDWRVITSALATKIAVLDVLMEKYNVNLNILISTTSLHSHGEQIKAKEQVLWHVMEGMELSHRVQKGSGYEMARHEMDINMAKVGEPLMAID